jgi:hypothetical protein
VKINEPEKCPTTDKEGETFAKSTTLRFGRVKEGKLPVLSAGQQARVFGEAAP